MRARLISSPVASLLQNSCRTPNRVSPQCRSYRTWYESKSPPAPLQPGCLTPRPQQQPAGGGEAGSPTAAFRLGRQQKSSFVCFCIAGDFGCANSQTVHSYKVVQSVPFALFPPERFCWKCLPAKDFRHSAGTCPFPKMPPLFGNRLR
jgi:hypothetical protein